MTICSECGNKIEGQEFDLGKDENHNQYIVCVSCYGDIVGLS